MQEITKIQRNIAEEYLLGSNFLNEIQHSMQSKKPRKSFLFCVIDFLFLISSHLIGFQTKKGHILFKK